MQMSVVYGDFEFFRDEVSIFFHAVEEARIPMSLVKILIWRLF